MGKRRLRRWILDNEFFSYAGQFSKSAFIAMSTWMLVMFKYAASGLSISYERAATTILHIAIPASTVTYFVKFDSGEAMALLSLVFGLYFGGKFTSKPPDAVLDAAENRRDIRQDAADERKDIREDAAQDRKDIREGK